MSNHADALTYFTSADSLFNQGKYQEACEEYRKAAEADPNYVDAFDGWGASLANIDKIEEAIEKFQKAIEINPNDVKAYNSWGISIYKQGEYTKAVEKFKKAIEINPNYAKAHHNWGLVLIDESKYDQAIEKFQKAIEINPQYAKAYNSWGVSLFKMGKYQEAIEQYRQALGINPNFVKSYINWGLVLDSQGEYQKAIEQYRKALELDSKSAVLYFNWGIVLFKDKEYEEAIEKYEKAIETDPDFAYAYHNIADCFWRQGKYKKGLEYWEQTCEVYERTKSKPQSLNKVDSLQYYGGVLHEIFGELTQAGEVYKEGLELDPNHIGILIGRINLHLEIKDEYPDQKTTAYWKARGLYKKVEGLLDEHIKLSEDAPTLLKMGQLHLTMEEYGEAKKYLLRALKKDDESAEIHDALGVLCTRQKNFKKGVQHFKKALDRDPDNLSIQSNLAEAYLKAKSVEDALYEYKKVLAITTDHVESQIGLGEVYTAMADAGDKELYGQAINHFNEGIRLAEWKKGSKRLKKKELAAVYYSRGYAMVNLYESSKTIRDESLLQKASEDFKNCSRNDPDNHKAIRALEKIEKRLKSSPLERLTEQIGPVVITLLALTVFILAQGSFFFGSPIKSIDASNHTILTFGSLMFMVAGLYLPHLLKLKVAGIELEKSVVDQITTSGSLGISK